VILISIAYKFKTLLRIIKIYSPLWPVRRVVFRKKRKLRISIHNYWNLKSVTTFNGSNEEVAHPLQISSVILYFQKYVSRNQNIMQSDSEFLYSKSLKDLGINTHTIEPSFNHENKYLNDYISGKVRNETNPPLLFLDGNTFDFLSNEEHLQISLLRNNGYIIIVDHPDLLVTKKARNILVKMLETVDFAIIHNPHIEIPENLSNKVFLWPAFPIPNMSNLRKMEDRKSGVLFSGGMHRGHRSVFCSYLRMKGIEVADQLYLTIDNKRIDDRFLNIQSSKFDKKLHKSFLQYENYFDLLGQYNMAFTNGYRNSKESLLAFRVCELMANKTLVFYENKSWIDHFFNPYEHYIPVENAPDLVDKIRYFTKNPGELTRITNSAYQVMDEKYSSRLFWKELSKLVYLNH